MDSLLRKVLDDFRRADRLAPISGWQQAIEAARRLAQAVEQHLGAQEQPSVASKKPGRACVTRTHLLRPGPYTNFRRETACGCRGFRTGISEVYTDEGNRLSVTTVPREATCKRCQASSTMRDLVAKRASSP